MAAALPDERDSGAECEGLCFESVLVRVPVLEVPGFDAAFEALGVLLETFGFSAAFETPGAAAALDAFGTRGGCGDETGTSRTGSVSALSAGPGCATAGSGGLTRSILPISDAGAPGEAAAMVVGG